MQGYPKNKLAECILLPKWMKIYDIETFTGVLECCCEKFISSFSMASAWSVIFSPSQQLEQTTKRGNGTEKRQNQLFSTRVKPSSRSFFIAASAASEKIVFFFSDNSNGKTLNLNILPAGEKIKRGTHSLRAPAGDWVQIRVGWECNRNRK